MKLDHPDFQLLFDALFRTSKILLEKQGGFLPIGAIVSPEGRVGAVGGSTREEQPGAQKVLEVLEGGLRGMAAKGLCRAAGMAIDTRLKAPPRKEDAGKDAIWIILEEKGGKSQGVFVPYAKSWLGGFTHGDPFTTSEKPRIFGVKN
ncbi:MAG: hypothetical protein WB780_04720 [Candidatus Acidiferrales bacterium]